MIEFSFCKYTKVTTKISLEKGRLERTLRLLQVSPNMEINSQDIALNPEKDAFLVQEVKDKPFNGNPPK